MIFVASLSSVYLHTGMVLHPELPMDVYYLDMNIDVMPDLHYLASQQYSHKPHVPSSLPCLWLARADVACKYCK